MEYTVLGIVNDDAGNFPAQKNSYTASHCFSISRINKKNGTASKTMGLGVFWSFLAMIDPRSFEVCSGVGRGSVGGSSVFIQGSLRARLEVGRCLLRYCSGTIWRSFRQRLEVRSRWGISFTICQVSISKGHWQFHSSIVCYFN